jgi:hypothetical protein
MRRERVPKSVFIGVEADVSYVDLQGTVSRRVRVTPRLTPDARPKHGLHDSRRSRTAAIITYGTRCPVIEHCRSGAVRTTTPFFVLPAATAQPRLRRFA